MPMLAGKLGFGQSLKSLKSTVLWQQLWRWIERFRKQVLDLFQFTMIVVCSFSEWVLSLKSTA